jgi:hypothetical protein
MKKITILFSVCMLFAVMLSAQKKANNDTATKSKIKPPIATAKTQAPVANPSMGGGKDTSLALSMRGVVRNDTTRNMNILFTADDGTNDQYKPVMWVAGYVVQRVITFPNTPQQQPVVVWTEYYTNKNEQIDDGLVLQVVVDKKKAAAQQQPPGQ